MSDAGIWFFAFCFLRLLSSSHDIFLISSICVVYYADFRVLNQPCVPGINPTWSCKESFGHAVGFRLLKFCRRPLCLCKRRCLTLSPGNMVVWLWVSVLFYKQCLGFQWYPCLAGGVEKSISTPHFHVGKSHICLDKRGSIYF